jgi:hypothetical protein
MATAKKDTITLTCLLRRPGGSKPEFGGKTYHFKPVDPSDPDAPHVCEIPKDDARAIYRFLAIKGAYVQADPTEELPARPAPAAGQTIHSDRAAAAEVKPIIVMFEGEQHDLNAMEPEALQLFARDKLKLKLHAKWNKQTVIAKIIEAARAAAEEDDGTGDGGDGAGAGDQ